MVSITNRSHQVSSRSMLGLCFVVVLHDEILLPMLNVHLSYKPSSSWRILFWSGGYPRQFNHLKMFRVMVVPGGAAVRG